MKKFRTNRKLSQIQFAKIIGVPRTTYQSWESGRRTPSEKNRKKLHQTIKTIQDSELAQNPYQKIEEYYNKYQPAPERSRRKIRKLIFMIILIIIFAIFW